MPRHPAQPLRALFALLLLPCAARAGTATYSWAGLSGSGSTRPTSGGRPTDFAIDASGTLSITYDPTDPIPYRGTIAVSSGTPSTPAGGEHFTNLHWWIDQSGLMLQGLDSTDDRGGSATIIWWGQIPLGRYGVGDSPASLAGLGAPMLVEVGGYGGFPPAYLYTMSLAAVVPEPPGWVLLAIAAGGLGMVARRRRQP